MGWYKAKGSQLVTRRWPIVIAAWIVLAIVLRLVAPKWESIAADGDLAYLPASVPSLVGQRQLDEAFPGSRVRSQMTIVLALPKSKLESGDLAIGFDLADVCMPTPPRLNGPSCRWPKMIGGRKFDDRRAQQDRYGHGQLGPVLGDR